MTPDMLQTLGFFIGGLVGSAAKAALTTSQDTFSRKSIVDIVIGGMVGALYPLYPIFPLSGNLIQQSMLIAVLSYFAGDVIQNAITNRIPALNATLSGKP